MILVDTSVWVDHLRKGSDRLNSLFLNAAVLVHPFVIGELACGNLHNRSRILNLLASVSLSRPVCQETYGGQAESALCPKLTFPGRTNAIPHSRIEAVKYSERNDEKWQNRDLDQLNHWTSLCGQFKLPGDR